MIKTIFVASVVVASVLPSSDLALPLPVGKEISLNIDHSERRHPCDFTQASRDATIMEISGLSRARCNLSGISKEIGSETRYKTYPFCDIFSVADYNGRKSF